MENEAAGEDKSSTSGFFCLMRVGRNSEWLFLPENSPTSVGRGVVVNYQLLSPSCPLMVSRLHCLFYPNSGQWTVLDNKTLNGVWVNGKRVPALEHFPLHLGDSIQIGVPVNGDRAEFDYLFTWRPLSDMKFCMARQSGGTASIQQHVKRKRATEEAEPSTSEPELLHCPPPDKSFTKPCPLSVKRRRQVRQMQRQQEVDRTVSDANDTTNLDQSDCMKFSNPG